MFHSLLFSVTLLLAAPSTVPPRIHQVQVEGNVRVAALTITRQVASKPDMLFDAVRLEADIKTLHEMGYFSQVEAETQAAADRQVDIVFHVREYPYVSSFAVDGGGDALQKQILDMLRDKKLEIKPATPFRPSQANQVAVLVRDFLRVRKYPNADARVTSSGEGNWVRVLLSIWLGRKIGVGQVLFTGNESIRASELIKQMQYSRPPTLVGRFKGQGGYSSFELASDLDRIRRYYQSKGFATASVAKPEVEAFNSSVSWPLKLITGADPVKLQVRIRVIEGEKYQLTGIRLEGDAKAASSEVSDLMRNLHPPCQYDISLLDSTRQKLVDTLGHHGYALAKVELEQAVDDVSHTVKVVYRIDPGDPTVVGRISFDGNKRIPDKFLRRQLRAMEGDVYDSRKLDESIVRLNKSELVQEVQRSDAALQFDEELNAVDIVFKVKEKDRQGIYGTGGTGGIGGGYLGVLYTAFNLLRLGETLSLEMDGGAAQSNMLLNIVGNHFLGSYFSLALSGFNRFTNFNVSSIVPGPENVVRLLGRRTTGGGLSGAYPLTRKIRVGMAFDVARERITGDLESGDVPTTNAFIRSDVTPFFSLDSTHGTGAATRGYQFSAGYGWSGPDLLRSIDSTHETIQFATYLNDPISKGRNSFAFRLQAGAMHPKSGLPLLLEERSYPGDEVVRGFHPGGLTPWAYVDGLSSPTLVPAGADTVAGLSAEYRVPLSGPLSGVGFADFGWTHLNPARGAQFYPGATLIDATNGLWRASVGWEFRLQLPMIRQPARLIFSWNPLRLNTFLKGSVSPLRLADPSHTIRFALGNIF